MPWLIFSTLADVLEKEFDPAFWETVNYGRKERWGFLEPPWDGKVGCDDTSTEESSPANTPKESPETQATDTAGASSPEPASESRQDVDLAAVDIPTLQNMEKTACERVAFHETRLLNAREHLTRIRKRLKRMQDDQSPDTLQPSPVADMEMEIID